MAASALPRKLTAIGTAGEAGQLFTVYEANWVCKECGQENYARRPRCFRCKSTKPAGELNYVSDPALQALQNNQKCPWQEVVDPTSYQIYYYNRETGATQWERPEEMGAAPMATGWFGRGQAGSKAAQRFAELNAKYLTRPARKQKEFIDPKKYHVEGSNEYNIWYGRFLGDYPDRSADKDAAPDRCSVVNDAGFTRADSGGAQRKERRFFCLHFARGACAKGADCGYYHRIPTPEDDARCDELCDCFGRQKHNTHRDDMNGVGSFMKPCRTLFVGNLLKQKYDTPQDLEAAMWKHFEEWGELENVNVIHRLSIAFPRYRLRTSAEFAKEAMTCQALDHGEILSIRWAHDDPNPVAQDSISRADKDALAGLLQAKGISLQQHAFEAPINYHIPGSSGEGESSTASSEALAASYPEIAYPNTDGQYVAPSTSSATSAATTVEQLIESATKAAMETQTAGMTEEQKASYLAHCREYYTKFYAEQLQKRDVAIGVDAAEANETGKKRTSDDAEVSDGDGKAQRIHVEEMEDAEESESAGGGWTAHVDPETGATFYYNAATGQSTWGDAPDEASEGEEN